MLIMLVEFQPRFRIVQTVEVAEQIGRIRRRLGASA